jgi:hypothetical protein
MALHMILMYAAPSHQLLYAAIAFVKAVNGQEGFRYTRGEVLKPNRSPQLKGKVHMKVSPWTHVTEAPCVPARVFAESPHRQEAGPPVAMLAPFQKLPRPKPRKDPLAGTIEEVGEGEGDTGGCTYGDLLAPRRA